MKSKCYVAPKLRRLKLFFARDRLAIYLPTYLHDGDALAQSCPPYNHVSGRLSLNKARDGPVGGGAIGASHRVIAPAPWAADQGQVAEFELECIESLMGDDHVESRAIHVSQMNMISAFQSARLNAKSHAAFDKQSRGLSLMNAHFFSS
jgi:hypothetical protein